MTLAEFPQALRRRWAAIVACALLAGLVTFLLTPAHTAPKVHQVTYNASVLLAPAVSSASVQQMLNQQANLELTAQLVTRDDVAAIAAGKLSGSPDPKTIGRSVAAVADPKAGVVTISAHAASAEEAAAIAQAFGAATIDFLSADGQQSATRQITEVQTELDASQARIASLAKNSAKPSVKAEQDVEMARYGVLYSRLHDLQETAASSAPLKILGSPLVSAVGAGGLGGVTVPGGRLGRTGLGGLLGLLLGLGVALTVQRLDRRLRGRREVERAYGLPVLAEVPKVSKRMRVRQPVVFAGTPNIAAVSAYRTLRSAVLLGRIVTQPERGDDENIAIPRPRRVVPQVVMITSAFAGAGKSVVTANLAAALAEADGSVLVIDCNLAEPTLHEHLGVPLGVGLAELLNPKSRLNLVDAIQESIVPGVRVISRGTATAHPAGVVLGIAEVLTSARLHADLILLDCPSLLGDSDAVHLLEQADAVMVACRAGSSTAEEAERARTLIDNLAVPALGIALISDRPAGRAQKRAILTVAVEEVDEGPDGPETQPVPTPPTVAAPALPAITPVIPAPAAWSPPPAPAPIPAQPTPAPSPVIFIRSSHYDAGKDA